MMLVTSYIAIHKHYKYSSITPSSETQNPLQFDPKSQFRIFPATLLLYLGIIDEFIADRLSDCGSWIGTLNSLHNSILLLFFSPNFGDLGRRMSGSVKLGVSSNSNHFITSILIFSKTSFLLFLLLLRLPKLLSRLRSINFSSTSRNCALYTHRGLNSLLNYGFRRQQV